jgi:hypothetical protein
MNQVEQWQKETATLVSQLIDTLADFGESNPDIPAQVMMGALGELLVNFSVTQAGTENTIRLLVHLKEAVELHGQNIASTLRILWTQLS